MEKPLSTSSVATSSTCFRATLKSMKNSSVSSHLKMKPTPDQRTSKHNLRPLNSKSHNRQQATHPRTKRQPTRLKKTRQQRRMPHRKKPMLRTPRLSLAMVLWTPVQGWRRRARSMGRWLIPVSMAPKAGLLMTMAMGPQPSSRLATSRGSQLSLSPSKDRWVVLHRCFSHHLHAQSQKCYRSLTSPRQPSCSL